ncbi:MAG: choice-of-anchor Q domain-containing protein [Actinomycetota bacterium]
MTRRHRRGFGALLAVMFLGFIALAAAPSARAQVSCTNNHIVSTPAELDAAITCYNAQTPAGDHMITFAANISYTGAVPPTIDSVTDTGNLTIDGNGMTLADGSGELLTVDNPGPATQVSNLTITNASSDGMAINNGMVTLTNVSADGNYDDGIDIDGGAVTINGGSASNNGDGGVDIDGGTVSMTNVAANSNYDDGVDMDDGNLTLNGGSANDNYEDGYDVSGGTASLTNASAAHNFGDGVDVDGGVVTIVGGSATYNYESGYDVEGGTVSISGSSASHNEEDGVSVEDGIVTINGMTSFENYFAGFFVYGGTVSISNSVAHTNMLGGAEVAGGQTTITNSTVHSNLSEGVYAASGNLEIHRSTIRNNNGPGIVNDIPCCFPGGPTSPGLVTTVQPTSPSGSRDFVPTTQPTCCTFDPPVVLVSNSTIFANTMPGVYALVGSIDVANSTVANNTIGLANGGGTITTTSSIIANNTTADCNGTITDGSANFSGVPGDLRGCPVASGALTGGSLAGALADNSCAAPCTQTLALLAGSNALNFGDCTAVPIGLSGSTVVSGDLSVDQRSAARVPDRCDAGAFELDDGTVNITNSHPRIYLTIDDPYRCGDGFYGQITGGTGPYTVDYLLTNQTTGATSRLPLLTVDATGTYTYPIDHVVFEGLHRVVVTATDSLGTNVATAFDATITTDCGQAPVPASTTPAVTAPAITAPITDPGSPGLAVTGAHTDALAAVGIAILGLGTLITGSVRRRQIEEENVAVNATTDLVAPWTSTTLPVRRTATSAVIPIMPSRRLPANDAVLPVTPASNTAPSSADASSRVTESEAAPAIAVDPVELINDLDKCISHDGTAIERAMVDDLHQLLDDLRHA